MSKISNTTSYPTKENPLGTDYVIGTDESSKETKTFTLQSIANLYSGTGAGTVTSVGLSAGTTGLIVTSDTVNPIVGAGTFTLSGTLATTNGGTGLTSIGTAGQVLKVNSGATGLEWGASGGSPQGSDTEIQYNNNGSFGGATGLNWDDSSNILSIATRFEGDIDGALLQQVLVKEPGGVSKGDIVYISGGTGDNPEVKKAQSDSASTMPALGIMKANTAQDTVGECVTSGEITGLGSLLNSVSTGDELFVSNTTAGGFQSSAPTGEANLIQKIGKVIKGGGGGALTVLGAFRTNATPNLNQGSLFIGNASNQASTLAIGANNYVLTSNGTTAVWQLSSGTVTGTGTANTLSKWSTGGTGIEDSSITDTGSVISIGNPTILKGDGTTNGNASNLKFYCSNNNHYVGLIGPNHSDSPASYNITLPNKIATQSSVSGGRVLEVNASGVGNWINTPSGSSAGHTIIDMADADTVTSAGGVNATYLMTTTVDSDFTASSIKLQFEIVPTTTTIEVGIYTYVEQGINSATSNVRLGHGSSSGSTTKRKVITLTADNTSDLDLTAGTNYVVALRCVGGNSGSGVFASSGKLSNVNYAATIDGNPALPSTLNNSGEYSNSFTATTLRPALTIY